MPKAMKRKLQIVATAQGKPRYTAAPWTARHHPNHSEIEAYVEATGNWTTLAEIFDATGVDAEATADFIAYAINAYDVNRALIGELAAALRRCLTSNALGWDAQYGAETAVRKAEQLVR